NGTEQTSPIKIIGVGNNLGIDKQPLYIVDGKEKSANEFESLDINSIHSINIIKDENFTKKYGDKAKNGVVEIITKENANSFEGKSMSDVKVIADNVEVIGAKSHNIKFSPRLENRTLLIVIDGQVMPNKNFEDINQDNIQSMTVLKAESAMKKYGNKAKNGVIEIITKK